LVDTGKVEGFVEIALGGRPIATADQRDVGLFLILDGLGQANRV
jgi:hypothetical protein